MDSIRFNKSREEMDSRFSEMKSEFKELKREVDSRFSEIETPGQ